MRVVQQLEAFLQHYVDFLLFVGESMDVGRASRCITSSTSGRSIRQLLPKMLHSLLAALVFIRRRTAEASCCGISWFRYSVIVFVDRRFKSL